MKKKLIPHHLDLGAEVVQRPVILNVILAGYLVRHSLRYIITVNLSRKVEKCA